MQVNSISSQYPPKSNNTNFGASAYFLKTRKIHSLMNNATAERKLLLLNAISKIKTYFDGCKIIKTKSFTEKLDLIRTFVLVMQDKREIPVLSINHKWKVSDIIELGDKLEALSTKYPEYNPHICNFLKKTERWSYKCKQAI